MDKIKYSIYAIAAVLVMAYAWVVPGDYPTVVKYATVGNHSSVWAEAAKQASDYDDMNVVMESVRRLNPGLDFGRVPVQPGTTFAFEVKDISQPCKDNAFKAFVKGLL